MNTSCMQKALTQQHVETSSTVVGGGGSCVELLALHVINRVFFFIQFISLSLTYFHFPCCSISSLAISSLMFNILHMDLLNTVLDLVVPPVSLVLLAFAWPALTFINFWEWLYGICFSENMEDKVVIITGASSGIGEQIVYEYAKRKVNLVLVARRLNRLTVISENAREFGAKSVMIYAADVIKEEDCRKFITETVNLFGRVDHLVNTASLGHTFYFEEATDSSVFPILMDINFWGNVYPTYAALPYLRESKGRIVVNASVESWLPLPRMSIYSAAKAALINFYETLRFEVKDEVGVTVASHGWIGSEMSGGKFMLEEGAEMQWKEEREIHVSGGPVKEFAKLIVKGACRGNSHVRYPSWYDIFFLYRFFAPKILNWTLQLLFANGSRRQSLVGTGRPLLEEASSSSPSSSSSTQSPPRRYFASSGSFPPSPVHPMSKIE